MKKLMFILWGILVFFPIDVHAGVVYPSDDHLDVRYISAELKRTGYVELVEGKTYYLSHPIRINSNQTINATGATIISHESSVRNDPSNYKADYNSMSNITIKGGTWLSEKKDGYKGSSFSFAHCKGITMDGVIIRTTNAEGHAIELVSCKDVNIKKCNVIAQGKGKEKSGEAMIQIDLASPNTAPFLPSKYTNGLPSMNITIEGCTVVGNRGICANFSGEEKKYHNKFHKNINIKNNTITGNKSEALVLFNVINAVIEKNKIITNSKYTKEVYSIGCRIANFGSNSTLCKSRITVRNNKIKGGKQGFLLRSHTKSRYGKLIIENNKIYCKKGKKNCLKIAVNSKGKSSAKKIVSAHNKKYKW